MAGVWKNRSCIGGVGFTNRQVHVEGQWFHANYRLILGEIDQVLARVDPMQVDRLVDAILAAEKVFAVGVGRVLLSLQAIVKRLNHLGVPAWFVGEINEPAISRQDLLIIASGSGETVVPVAIAQVAKRHGAKIAHIGSNTNSSLASLTDLFVRIPVRTKLDLPDEIFSRQIMSSLFEQALLVLGDAVSLSIAERKDIGNIGSLWRHHANLE